MDNIGNLILFHVSQLFEKNNLNIKTPVKIGVCKHADGDYSLNNLIEISKNNNISQETIINIIKNDINDIYDVNIIKIYINFKLKKSFLINKLKLYNLIEGSLIKKVDNPLNIIIDYSSPNVAKDMHVGHLRSTIIGDTLANLFEKSGHNVSRINHIGDYGLPFGMIIQYINDNNLDISNINLHKIYVSAKSMYDDKNNSKFQAESHIRTVELQNKTGKTYEQWQQICNISKNAYTEIYDKLNIKLKEMGESFYNLFIPDVINELKEKKLLIEEDGRLIVKTVINNKEIPLTVVKSDGGYTYDTTDLTALKYRITVSNADMILYVVDSGQSIHFKQIINVAKQMNWLKNNTVIEHINFGIVKGINGLRMKSRAGENPKLIDLLNQSVEETLKVMTSKAKENNTVNMNDVTNIAYGSIKYADLSVTRTNDYVFSFENMLAFTGNTIMYIMYAFVRINSIKKIYDNISENDREKIVFNTEVLDDFDMNLIGLSLILPEIISQSATSKNPHIICSYLYEIADNFHKLYNTQRCITHDQNNMITHFNKIRFEIFLLIKKIMQELFEILNINTVDKL